MKKKEASEAEIIERSSAVLSTKDDLAERLTEEGSKASLAMRDRLLSDKLKEMVYAKDEKGMDFTDRYLLKLEEEIFNNPNHKFTIDEYLKFQRALGQDVNKAVTIRGNIDLNKEANQETVAFLKNVKGN